MAAMDTPPEHRDSDIAHFMRDAATKMAEDYQRIRAYAKKDPGTAGDDGEGNWQKLLSAWLPSECQVETKGQVVFPDGFSSPQVDVVILDPCYPKRLRDGKQHLAGGVLAAFECKLTLNARHIAEAGKTCSEIKQRRLLHGSPYRELHSRISYGLLAHSHSWKNEGSDPVGNVCRALYTALEEIQHPREMLDWVCVADLGTWIAAKSIFVDDVTPPGKPKRPYPAAWDNIFKPRVGTSYFHMSGVNPMGCFIVSLLDKLAWDNPRLRGIVWDMFRSRLIRRGQGRPRSWPLDILPAPIIKEMCSAAKHGHWDEWSAHFSSIG